MLRLTLPEQAGSASVRRADGPAQTRQVGDIASLRIEVSGQGITPIVVECPLPGPSTSQCQVDDTNPTVFIVTVTIEDVPRNVPLMISASVLNSSRAEIFRGEMSVSVPPTQAILPVTIPLTPVSPPGAALVANAGMDQTVVVGQTVFLRGDASTNINGRALTFTWVFSSRPAGSGATLSDPTNVNPSFVVDQPGDYVLSLTVSDGPQSSAPDSVILSTVNSAPMADAGLDQSAAIGAKVTLHGGGSSDIDGDVLHFTWSFVSRPAGSAATLSGPNAVRPSFVVDIPGTYVVQLIVSDGALNSAPDTVTISTVNSAPVADAGLDQTVRVGATVSLDGGDSFDDDDTLPKFTWALIVRPTGSNASLANDTTMTPSFVVDVPGTYVVQLIVNDDTTNSSPDTVTISTVNSFPVAEAGTDQTVASGTTVFLDGNGSSDADDDLFLVSWSLIAVPPNSTAQLNNPSAVTPTFVADQLGDYVAQLIVFDLIEDDVRPSKPDTVSITVLPRIMLALAGISGNTVMVGVPATVVVTLSFPAPAGGVTVAVTSSNPGVLAVTPPGTVFIAAGATTGQVTMNVLAPGFATVFGNAPGFLAGSQDIMVLSEMPRIMLTVAGVSGNTIVVGRPVTLVVTLSFPAPTNGVTVTVTPSNTNITVTPPGTVFIAAGATTGQVTINGVASGSATVFGNAPGFLAGSQDILVVPSTGQEGDPGQPGQPGN